MKSIKLKISGMSCSGCAGGIKKALEAQNLVKTVSVDFDSKIAEIKFDEKEVKPKEIIKVITSKGYKVEQLKE